jgi:hypothetical protein
MPRPEESKNPMARSRWQRLMKHLTSRWSFPPKHERRQGRSRQLTWPDIGLTTRSKQLLSTEQSVELFIAPQSCATSHVTEGGTLAVRPPGLRQLVLELLPKTSTKVYAGIVIGVKSWVRLCFDETLKLRMRCAGSPTGSRNRSLKVVRIRPDPCLATPRGHIDLNTVSGKKKEP